MNDMRKKMLKAFLAALVIAAAWPAHARSQTRPRRVEPGAKESAQSKPSPPKAKENPALEQPPQEVGPDDVLRVETTLVTVPVSVTDRNGRYIADLSKEDFRIYEDGVEQEVAYFAAVEKPFTVILVLDTSSSVWSKLSQIKKAAQAFVEQLRPDDQVMVTTFARGLTIKCRATNDRQKIRAAIDDTGRGLSTHLYDAMDKLMRKELSGLQGRKAIVLFTDGVDAKSSDATYKSTVHLAEELDALIYPIRYDTYDAATDAAIGASKPAPQGGRGLPSILGRIPLPLPTIGGGGGGGNGSSRADYELGERYLHELAEMTGGRVYEANRDLSYLQDAFSHIAEELRRQYSLGYYPKQTARTGERRRIRVSVSRADVAVRARQSYIYKESGGQAQQPSTAKDKEGSSPQPVLQKKPFAGKLSARAAQP
jgi:VWFA-related protein